MSKPATQSSTKSKAKTKAPKTKSASRSKSSNKGADTKRGPKRTRSKDREKTGTKSSTRTRAKAQEPMQEKEAIQEEVPAKSFRELGLSESTLAAIDAKGFEEPTAIQSLTIPMLIKNETNIIAQAQTGTGKTAAFALPLIELMDDKKKHVQALILAPTRELAIQVAEETNSLKGDKNLSVVPVYGGQSIDQQLRKLKKGVSVVVGTPGRLIDHLKRKTLNLKMLDYLVLDEADEMLNMGFIEDIEEIMQHANPDKRILLFSATMPTRIKDLARKYIGSYELLAVAKKQLTTHLTEQIYFEVKASDRFEGLCRIIDYEDEFFAMIFCRTKRDVDELSLMLGNRGYDVAAIHGDVSQVQRERLLKQFRDKSMNILVATDVAARGIDVSHLTHVINYALPQDSDSYVHRIGRTGRAGKQGTAITFITPSEYKKLMFIQRMAKADIKKSELPKVKDIIDAKRKKIDTDLDLILEEKHDKSYYDWAEQLLEKKDPKELVAGLLNHSFESELNPETYRQINGKSSKKLSVEESGKARLFVALGKKDQMNPRKLCELLSTKASFKPRLIRDVEVLDKFSFVTVPFEYAEKIVSIFKSGGRKPLVTHARKK